MKIEDSFIIHNITDVNPKLLEVLLNHAEGHCLFDHYITYEDLTEQIDNERGVEEENRDNDFINYALELLEFMIKNDLNGVCLKGFHY